MDRTLKRAKRNNKRRGQRNHGAWQRFSPDGKTCRYCEHDGSKHLCRSGQPHFYRPATEAERRDPTVMLYRHTPVSSTGQALPDGGSMLVRRMTVANHASSSPPSARRAPRASGRTRSCATSATWALERWSASTLATRTWQSPPEAA